LPWSAQLFFAWDTVETLLPWIVYARGCGRRQLAMVWTHIQQRYDSFFLVTIGHD
jgi:hypothetical protein